MKALELCQIGKVAMISKELELELKLTQLNNKIILYDKLIKRIRPNFIQLYFYKRLGRIIEQRNKNFKLLRELMRKKYPEKFIRSNND